MRHRPAGAAFAAAMCLTLAPAAAAAPLVFPPRPDDGISVTGPPPVTAEAWLVYDEAGDLTLASRSPDETRHIASTTKIMTALVALERSDPESLVTISGTAAGAGEREIGLVKGETLSLKTLIQAALIHSANDAATAIAEHVGGSVSEFVGLMNDKAAEMGLTKTRFANPHGLDAPDHHSTARDLLAVAREAMANPVFRDAVRSRLLVLPDAPDGTSRVGRATNLLLHDYEGMAGVKTGYTTRAKLTMVASAEREGRRLYVVVLGAEGEQAHLNDVRGLLDWAFESLGRYAAISLGASHEPAETPRASSGVEAYVHLAAQGLVTSPPAAAPSPPIGAAAPPPVVITRRPKPEVSLRGAAVFWWDLLIGDR